MSLLATPVAYSDVASGTHTVLTVGRALPIGSVLCVGVASGGGGSTLTLTDSKGNTWTQQEYASNATSPASVVAIFTTVLTTALTATDTITGASTAGSGCGDLSLVQITASAGTISIGTGSAGTGNSNGPVVPAFNPGLKGLVVSFLVESSNTLQSGTNVPPGWSKIAAVDTPSRPRAIVGQYGTPGGTTTVPFLVSIAQQYATAAISFVENIAPPAGFVNEMANFNYNSTSVKVQTIPVTHAVPAGDYIVLAVDPAAGGGTNTTCTVTDTKGNTYTLRQSAANGPGNGQPFILTCPVGTALTTSDTLTVTVGTIGSQQWMIQGLAFSGITGYDQGAANNGATGKTLTVGPTSAGAQPTQLAVAAFAGTGTGVTMTGLSPGFTAQTPVATVTSPIKNLWMVWGFVSTSGTRTVSASMSDAASHPWAGVLVVLNSNAPAALHTTFIWDGTDWVACDVGLWVDGAWVFA